VPTVLLVRHAQASFGAAQYDELSTLGHAQAARLDEYLSERIHGPARLVAGTLRRQIDTAQACPRLRARGAPIERDPRWNEYDSADVLARHGPGPGAAGVSDIGAPPGLSNVAFQDVLDRALQAWVAAGPDTSCAESWPAFRARSRAALDGVARDLGAGETAVVVTSGGVIAALVSGLLDARPTGFVALNRMTLNTAVCTILRGRSGLRLLSFGEHGHLGSERALLTFR